jgi:hypothetical protein
LALVGSYSNAGLNIIIFVFTGVGHGIFFHGCNGHGFGGNVVLPDDFKVEGNLINSLGDGAGYLHDLCSNGS